MAMPGDEMAGGWGFGMENSKTVDQRGRGGKGSTAAPGNGGGPRLVAEARKMQRFSVVPSGHRPLVETAEGTKVTESVGHE